MRSVEHWKAVVGYEGRYEVSDLGRIRSLNFNKTKRRRLMSLVLQRYGYKHVRLCANGRARSFTVHSLVLRAFEGPPPAGHETRHLNGRHGDNRLSNLKWGTPAENAQDQIRHGVTHRGTRNFNAKLTDEQVLVIHTSQEPRLDLAKRFGVDKTTVRNIQNGRWWAWLTGGARLLK